MDRPPQLSGLSSESLTTSLSLFRRAQRGDANALNSLYTRYLPRLSRWASGRIPIQERGLKETGDLVAEALVQFLGKLSEFEPKDDGALMAYLRSTVLNKIRDMGRAVKRRPRRVDSDVEGHAGGRSPYEICVDRDVRERYEAALANLPEDDRASVVMRVEFAYSWERIAEATGKPSVDAARMSTKRAIVRLAREMEHA